MGLRVDTPWLRSKSLCRSKGRCDNLLQSVVRNVAVLASPSVVLLIGLPEDVVDIDKVIVCLVVVPGALVNPSVFML